MVDFLADDAILLVFAVVGLGAGLGTVRVRGMSLGPAAALFAGLGVGAIDDELSAAAGLGVLRELGLVMFTYTIGLASGPTFLIGLRRGGAQAVALTSVLIAGLAAASVVVAGLFDLSAADRAGIFAGSTTNTPALQAAADSVGSGDPVVAYSIAYPLAVGAMLVMLTLLLGRRLPLPSTLAPPAPPRAERIVSWTVHATSGATTALADLRDRYPALAFSRIEHDGIVRVATDDQCLRPGDHVVAVGPESAVAAFCRDFGERSDRHLPLDRSTLDFRRIAVSNRRLAGRRLAELELGSRFGARITRVRRGDIDLVATDDLVLQLGDRVRVVGPVERLGEIAQLLGDSERRLAEVDALGLALGIAAGMAIGAVPIPMPGGVEIELGPGGGPLVVGIALGIATRTGPITWQIPHGANLVLRQLGILVFLGCAGLGAGSTFAETIGTRRGLELAIAGLVVAGLFAAVVPLVIEIVLRRDVVATAGMFAGIETQPAALAFASERRGGDDRITVAYTLVFPAAMIAKVIAVQFLV